MNTNKILFFIIIIILIIILNSRLYKNIIYEIFTYLKSFVVKSNNKGYAKYRNNTIYLDKDNSLGTRLLSRNLGFETYMDYYFNKYINKNSVVLDVGANIGIHTLNLSKLAKKIYSFEPNKNTFEILKKNIEVNNINNVKAINKGLSNTNKMSKIVCPDNHASQCYVEDFTDIIEITTLDSLKFNKCDFMKIDVEGLEEKVLLGGLNTIKKYKPVIILENIMWSFDKNSINILKQVGYKYYRISMRDIIFIPY